jgi:putative glutamine amidotransferase
VRKVPFLHPERSNGAVAWLAATVTAGSILGAIPPVQAAPARPHIGVTGIEANADTPDDYTDYLKALQRAGAEPVTLKIGQPVPWNELDALLITGGEDIDPALYGAQPHASYSGNRQRDAAELRWATQAFARKLPVLGICRGSQLLNALLGGTLVQDIPTQVDKPLVHRDGAHQPVTILPGTGLAGLSGSHIAMVNHYHHQAASTLAPGLRPVARTADGVIEAWEAIPGGPFGSFLKGYQFHPEEQPFPTPKLSERIFANFVAAAQRHRTSRSRHPAGTAIHR